MWRWRHEVREHTAAYSTEGLGFATGPARLATAAPPTVQGPWWSLNSPSTDFLFFYCSQKFDYICNNDGHLITVS